MLECGVSIRTQCIDLISKQLRYIVWIVSIELKGKTDELFQVSRVLDLFDLYHQSIPLWTALDKLTAPRIRRDRQAHLQERSPCVWKSRTILAILYNRRARIRSPALQAGVWAIPPTSSKKPC